MPSDRLDGWATFNDTRHTMKTILLFLFLAAFGASAQINTAQYRGEYLGVMLPASGCSNERLTLSLSVDGDGNVSGTMFNYDTTETNWFTGDIAGSRCVTLTRWNPLSPEFDPLNPIAGWPVRISFSARGGTAKGTVDGRLDGFCRYTFTAYRRFKVAQ